MSNLLRKSHFLGAKFRSLRKANRLTLQEVSERCIQLNADDAPSVSYLSMIETGKRTPSTEVLELLASVFQKDARWFMDENSEVERAPNQKEPQGGAARIPLEPGFLFTKDQLEAAIPELLSQTGTTGRQFAHLLIRSYQEKYRNRFPDLERSAEEIGERRFPLSVDDLLALCRRHDLEIRWFDRAPERVRDQDRAVKTIMRSFFEAPGRIYLNERLRDQPARLKYDLAAHLGHKVLHGGDGQRSAHASGGSIGGISQADGLASGGMNTQDVLFAWRDFECSFFAGALLCPKQPFRRFLTRESYRVSAGQKLDLSAAVIMRRMTSVSPYRYWHYFDAYPPGYLRAVYRGNGIPLPWGNMSMVSDPCPGWAVFRMIHRPQSQKPTSQVSVLQDGDRSLLYCCHSLRVKDMAGNPHVLSVGLDLVPALNSQGEDGETITAEIAGACLARRGEVLMPKAAARALSGAGRVMNIAWIEEALEQPARVICPRSSTCPRTPACEPLPAATRKAADLAAIRQEIIAAERTDA
jgi:transcriptional regulator with XRE-family HTH domain